MKLSGKRYLVTGASSGLGLALVRYLIRIKGTKITAVARNIEILKNMPSDRVFSLSMDVANPENISFMLDEAIRLMGGIDCLVACAGFGYYERFLCQDYEHIERIFQTNVISPLFMLERYLRKTSGKITFVAVSSMLGKFGLPGMALYSATKHALDGFQDSYRFEKPKRLHYMTVYPISFKSNFWNKIALDLPIPKPMQSVKAAAYSILNGLRHNKQMVYTSVPIKVMFLANFFIPLFVLLYQHKYKHRFQKWLEKNDK